MGLRPAPMGIPVTGPGEQKRPRRKRRTAPEPAPSFWAAWDSLEETASRGATDGPDCFLCFRGYGTPGKLDLYGQIRCLPRQRHAGVSDPGRPEDLMQTRNRLRICSYPAHALPVLLSPPPGGPTACPEGGSRPPDPGGIKAAPQEAQDRPGTAPQLREDLGPIGGNTATRGQQTAPQQLPALPCI